MNTAMLDVLIKYPSAFILNFIFEPFAGAALAYGLVWLAMRPKGGKTMHSPFLWHSCGVAATVMGSAIFRIIAMATFGGFSAYEPPSKTWAAGFYTLIIPAIIAAGYIAWLKKRVTNENASQVTFARTVEVAQNKAASIHLTKTVQSNSRMSARTAKGWLWFKLVAILMLVTFGIKILFALGVNNSINKVALAFVGAVGGTIVFGGIAFLLGWLTGEDKPHETLATPQLTASNTIADTSAIDAIYEKIDQELKTDNLDRATWTRAQGDAEGNAERTKALYIKYRAQRLLAANRDESGHQATFDAFSVERPAEKYNSRFVAATAGMLAVAVVAVIVIEFFTEKPAPTKGEDRFKPLDLSDYATPIPQPAQASKTPSNSVDWSQFTPVQPPVPAEIDAKADARAIALQVKALEDEVPDWRSIVGVKGNTSNAYRRWLSKQPPEYQDELNSTNSAAVIARSIAKFKAETK